MKHLIKILMALLLFLSVAYAVEFPISELGGCNSQEECKLYCDEPDHIEECINYAEEKGMMDEKEIEEAKKVLNYLKEGNTPGGCRGKEECEKYCEKKNNFEECIEFGLETGIISKEEAENARRMGNNGGPGGCKGKKECEEFCSKEENTLECAKFAYENDMISKDIYQMLKNNGGKGPGGCIGEKECDEFCSKEENGLVCAEFAYKNGQISEEEYQMIKNSEGKGPGGCVSREECDEFCSKEENMVKCANFSYQNGQMTKEEYELIKMTKGKGPGGCSSEQECEEFCKKHETECMDFALMTGLWEEDEGLSKEQRCIAQCFIDNGLSYSDCPRGKDMGEQKSECIECGKKCAKFYEGPCLNYWEIKDEEKECRSKGEQFRPEAVKGDSGEGAECIIDFECVEDIGLLGKKPEEDMMKREDLTKEEIMELKESMPEGMDKKVPPKDLSKEEMLEMKGPPPEGMTKEKVKDSPPKDMTEEEMLEMKGPPPEEESSEEDPEVTTEE